MFRRASWQRARRMRRPLPLAWRDVLERRVALYHRLPPAEQQEWIGRMQVLLGEVSFEAAVGLEHVDQTMRLLIVSQASLCLLHRPLAELPRLRTIIVYPGAYRARERRQTPEGVLIPVEEDRHGEAWAHGVMVLSWDDVAYDAEHIDDGLNVVLHEMAHLLDAETGDMDGIPLLRDRAMAQRWRKVLEEAYARQAERSRLGRRSALEAYAFEDRSEFFAVATEVFFEAPQGLRRDEPELWSALREFYRVEPLSWLDASADAGLAR